ncbi:uncharacterized protein LOC123210927 [Mangifera indica]|uniref:uncharacterized protein LOC123210907 n=1 Tax=Mangifera indica TaxID=29780 RepID=UPI001CFC36A3|nr:uncharacterized protein LOC123210907 [Mangifera indica]XP_044485361.1 uncharacterized protein LOC123210927 [Mangifera indica]
MHRPQLHSRLNLVEVKAQLVKRLGPDRSKLYFFYLDKLLSLKLSKVEFNQLCLRVIGRENVKIHNQLIRSILKNACNAKVPPSGSTQYGDGLGFTSDGYQQNRDVSPWGAQSGVSVGSDGKVEFSQQSTITGNNVVLENGDLGSHEIQKPWQNHQVVSKKMNNEGKIGLCHPAKEKVSADGLPSVDSNGQGEVLVGDGIELSTRSPIQAPLGLPLCSFSVGRARKASHLASSGRCFSSYDSGGLLDTETLKKRMQNIAAAEGLEGVSVDCANFLNIGLDIYLKRLIRSSIELVGARCGHDLMPKNISNYHNHAKRSGVFPGYHFHMQSNSRPLEEMIEHRHDLLTSSLDFKVAMWLKPQQLGEDWPLILEKICTHSLNE